MNVAENLHTTMAAIDKALLSGNFDELGRLAEQLGVNNSRLESLPPSPEVLKSLHNHAATTMGVLAAARDGIAAARQRLKELAAVRDGLVTYADDGRRHAFSIRGDHNHRI